MKQQQDNSYRILGSATLATSRHGHLPFLRRRSLPRPLVRRLFTSAVLAASLAVDSSAADLQPGQAAQTRRPSAPVDLPPMPPSLPPPIRWEAGPWWSNATGPSASLAIDSANAQNIVLGSGALSHPEFLTLQSLALGGPGAGSVTLALGNLGLEHPLHVLGDLSLHSNAVLRVDNSALVINGTALIGGRLNLGSGHLIANSNLVIGDGPNLAAAVTVGNGTLCVTNPQHNARLLIGSSGKGRLLLNGGRLEADSLQVTSDSASQFIFRSGHAKLQSLAILNHGPMIVGDGVHPATLELAGGTNCFSTLLVISSNATLQGHGIICGPVVNYGNIIAGRAGDALAFASTGPFISSVTNWGRLYMTNGGILSFQESVLNKAQLPIMAMDATDASFKVQFVSLGGLLHVLECRPASGDAKWTPVASAVGTGELLSLTDSAPARQPRLYRLRVGR